MSSGRRLPGVIRMARAGTPYGRAMARTGHEGAEGPRRANGGIGGLGARAVRLLRAIAACPITAVDPVPAARHRALEFGADLAQPARAVLTDGGFYQNRFRTSSHVFKWCDSRPLAGFI